MVGEWYTDEWSIGSMFLTISFIYISVTVTSTVFYLYFYFTVDDYNYIIDVMFLIIQINNRNMPQV